MVLADLRALAMQYQNSTNALMLEAAAWSKNRRWNFTHPERSGGASGSSTQSSANGDCSVKIHSPDPVMRWASNGAILLACLPTRFFPIPHASYLRLSHTFHLYLYRSLYQLQPSPKAESFRLQCKRIVA